MDTITAILAAQYRAEITKEQAERRLAQECTCAELAEFIVEAKNRGWISNWNLGLNDEGNRV